MPTYEYECSGCQETYDVMQRMSDPALATCIKCGGGQVKRKISVPTILTRRQTQRIAAPEAAQQVPHGEGHLIGGNFGAQGFAVDAVPDDFTHPQLGALRAGVRYRRTDTEGASLAFDALPTDFIHPRKGAGSVFML